MTAPVDPPEAPPRGGSRAVASFLDRLEALIAKATPHELAQLGYGLARVLDARGRDRAPDPDPLQEGFGMTDLLDDAVKSASPEKMAALRAVLMDIMGEAATQYRARKKAARAARPGA